MMKNDFDIQDYQNIGFIIETTKATHESKVEVIDEPKGYRLFRFAPDSSGSKIMINMQRYVFYNEGNPYDPKSIISEFVAGYSKTTDTIYYHRFI